ncbi:MAG: serine hydrolase [Gemmatimonadetes bacterium]|nr:serine hydrolase [Gemmatimonadota bacterium]
MRRRHAVLISIPAIIAVVAFAGSRAAQPAARPALGFIAKVVCSNIFVGNVTRDQALADLPDEPIARLVRTDIDTDARIVAASIPFVAKRRAAYREGLGCTLLPATTLPSPPAGLPADGVAPVTTGIDEDSSTRATGRSTRLDAVVADAFTEPDPEAARRTRAIVIVHHGRIIAERYADGYGPDNRFTGWSMTKSVMNALVGILIAEDALHLQAGGLRPEWRAPEDPRGEITLHDLLTMSSGLGFDESYTPTGAATRMLFDAHDAAAVAAASALVHEPGTAWSYSSATTNIVSALLRASFSTHEEYVAFPRRALFDRIGMRSAVLEPDPSGTFVGSSFMFATARDWARFGLLFLNDGTWNGERILPEGWVEYSVTPAAAAPLGQYGAHWWLNAGEAADSTRRVWPALPRDIFWASGFEGQYVAIVPSHDLVVVRLGVTSNDQAWRLGTFLGDVLDAINVANDDGGSDQL